MKNSVNISRIIRRLEKKYGSSELLGFIIPYAEGVKKSARVIKYPDFFERVHGTVYPEMLTNTESISAVLGNNVTYNELSCFYDYAVIHAIVGLDLPIPSEELLCKTVDYLKALFFIDVSELYYALSGAERVISESIYFKGCDDDTKNACRKRIAERSKHLSLTEEECARLFLQSDPFERKKSLQSRLYFPVLAAITATASVLALLVTRHIAIFFFLILPLSEASKQLTDFIFSHLVKTRPIPKKKITKIPKEAKTLTVITALLSGKESDLELVEKLRSCHFANRDENALFGLLCDLTEAESAEEIRDATIKDRIANAVKAVNSKYGISLFVFVRSRRYAPTEGKYMGWERKRGAIIELTRLINGKNTSISLLCGEKTDLEGVRYIITLDSDTRLYTGAVKDLLGAMLHPSNTPVIKNGRVIKGYAILQPRMETSLSSAEKTPFAILSAGNGGSDIYATAAYETYQSVFNEGIFCGKGIFDIKAFSLLIDGAFPDGAVLSHDLLEGSRLRAGALTDISLTDDLPKSPLSCFERSHRWIRGDIQSLAFAGRYVYDEDGRLRKNPISRLSKYKIYDNVRRALVPISALCALVLYVFRPNEISFLTFFFALSYLFMPFVLSTVALIRSAGKRYFSFLIPDIFSVTANLIYSLSSLIHTAINTADAVFRAGYRMLFSRKRLLQWKTASESERGIKGLPLYLYKMLPSMLIGIALAVFCPRVPIMILGIFSALFPFAAYLIGRPIPYKSGISDGKKELLDSYARDIWSFFSTRVGEEDNHLPPDNVQFSPDERVAHRTSPTNIGLYLLSCAAAYKMDIITENEAIFRIKNTIDSIDNLPKWRGNLYNWYDTRTLVILGTPYVSTVDSGNLITSLVTLKGILEKEDETPRIAELISRIEKLVSETDLASLYDKKKKLFFIGINTSSEHGDGHYDLFTSEARTTSFYAIASGSIPREHWRYLRRIPTSSGGYLGLLSWTGTTFEYLMPSLVLPSRQGSLSYEALSYAVREQKRAQIKGVWGRSESGYFNFDADLNYQYKAFGAPSLGIKGGLEKDDVISPYSSFLCLPFSPDAALYNLEKLKNMGMYGEYGFYEAVDFTPSRVGHGYAVIKSYMAHHMGMSLIAIANACLDDIFVSAFMSDPYCSSGVELLEEKVPVRVKTVKKIHRHDERPLPSLPRFIQPRDERPKDSQNITAMISENGLCAVASGDMLKLSALKGEISVDPFVFGKTSRPFFIFSADGARHNVLDGRMKYRTGDGKISWYYDTRHLEAELSLSILGASRTFVFTFLSQGHFEKICPMLVFRPALVSNRERMSHPAYSDLMICSEYDSDNNTLIYFKNGKSSSENNRYIAVSFESGAGSADFVTRRGILGSGYTEKDVEALIDAPFDRRDGALIDPLCAIKKESKTKGKYICNILISVGYSRAEALASLSSARNIIKSGRGKNGALIAERYLKQTMSQRAEIGVGRVAFKEISGLILSLIHKRRMKTPPSSTYSINDLWKHGISGDNPIVCIRLDSLSLPSPQYRYLMTFISAHKHLSLSGIKLDTVILYESGGEYTGKTKEAILDAAEKCASSFFINRAGGIFIIDECGEKELFESVSILYADLSPSFTVEKLIQDNKRESLFKTVPISTVSSTEYKDLGGLKTAYGEFTDDGYVIKKLLKVKDAPPHSYVYSRGHFGTLLCDCSLGYTWIGNCSQRRITPFIPDNLLGMDGERLIAVVKDVEYDLISCSHTVTFGRGGAVYEGKAGFVSYKVTVSIDPYLPCKAITVEYDGDASTEYRVTPVLGDMPNINRPIETVTENDLTLFIPRVSNGKYDIGFLTRAEFGDNTVFFLLGAYPFGGEKTLERIKEKYRSKDAFLSCPGEYESVISSLLPKIDVTLANKYLEVMTEYYLPYQALVCRFFGRTGFYQSGGAYGFRDQLQDCLCIMLGAPHIARTHILRCACHQYEEGDVMHWWHNVRGESRGVRTRYTDDLLWLPYVTAKYIAFSGDSQILDIELPYLTSPPLSDEENDRYERAVKGKYRTSLYFHCVRAIERALSFGQHGLPLMGGGDWNDGMNEVGKGGGESVWLGFFLSCILDAFAPIALTQGDVSGAAKYRRIKTELLSACEKCFREERYLRAFFSDGTLIGGSAFIDLLPQAFSVFAKADEKRSVSGLKAAYRTLFDSENSVFALLSPAFKRPLEHDPGYISSYPVGIRENGGQYTHAAVWAAMAMTRCGMKEEAAIILRSINPASICSTVEGFERYKGEAYFLAGDVSTNPAFPGRCGWSLYTGASGWFFNAVIGSLMGIVISDDTFTVMPALSRHFPCYQLTLAHRKTVYTISAKTGKENACILDGRNVNNLFYFDEKEHYLEITVEISSDMQ